jgi:DNA-binding transcriptional LysR family regulator
MGFDRADLAILAATHHAGVAMGRRQLASQALASGALVMPFPDMAVRCEPRYYLATLLIASVPRSRHSSAGYRIRRKGHPETGPGLLSAKVMAMSALFVQ